MIVEDEDHESDEESDESVEVQPRASKRPRRAVTQNTQQSAGNPLNLSGAKELLTMRFLLSKLGQALLVSGEVSAHL